MSTVDSQKYIAQQVRAHDYDRYFATLFCPTECRLPLLALYAFNIEIATIRETVSEPLIGHMRLQWWRDTIGAVYDGQPPGHPVATALADAVTSFELTRELFYRMARVVQRPNNSPITPGSHGDWQEFNGPFRSILSTGLKFHPSKIPMRLPLQHRNTSTRPGESRPACRAGRLARSCRSPVCNPISGGSRGLEVTRSIAGSNFRASPVSGG